MEHQVRELNWLLENGDPLRLKIENLTWISEILPKWTDMHVTMQIEGRTVNGWGADPVAETALCKAASEALERFFVIERKASTSNGFAVHSSRDTAGANARNELRERDLFLCHFLTRTGFRKIGPEQLGLAEVSLAKIWAEKRGLNARYFHLGSSGAICVIDGYKATKPIGYVLGSAHKAELTASIYSATVEAFRQAAILLEDPKRHAPFSEHEFITIRTPSFQDHLRLSLNIEYANSIDHLFDDRDVSELHVDEDSAAINCDTVQIEIPKCSPTPLFVSQASSPCKQQMWLGRPDAKHINFERLSRFANRNLSVADIHLRPHPFN